MIHLDQLYQIKFKYIKFKNKNKYNLKKKITPNFLYVKIQRNKCKKNTATQYFFLKLLCNVPIEYILSHNYNKNKSAFGQFLK